MLRHIRSGKRPRQDQQASVPSLGASHLSEALGAVEGSFEAHPAAKKRRIRSAASNAVASLRQSFLHIYRGNPDTVNALRDHDWTPTPAVGKARGRPPTHQWTRTREIALIRLVVKTSLPFDYVHVALREEDFTPSEQACLAKWKKIFHSPPEQARVHCPKGKERRYKDLKVAYEYHCKHQSSLKSNLLQDEDGAQPDVEGLDQSAIRNGVQEATPPITPGDLHSTVESPMDVKQHNLALAGQVTPFTPESEDSPTSEQPGDPDLRNKEKLPRGWKPSTRADCAKLLEMPLLELEWLMYGRDSWKSRISELCAGVGGRKSMVDPDQAHIPPVPALAVPIQPNEPKIVQFLQRQFEQNDMSYRDIGRHVAQLVVNGEDPNAADENGISPLHRAVAAGCLPVIWALFCAGANPDACTNDGQSVSAYSRTFARDDTLPVDRTGHIEAARETIKYLRDLKKVLQRKRTQQDRNSLQPGPTALDHTPCWPDLSEALQHSRHQSVPDILASRAYFAHGHSSIALQDTEDTGNPTLFSGQLSAAHIGLNNDTGIRSGLVQPPPNAMPLHSELPPASYGVNMFNCPQAGNGTHESALSSICMDEALASQTIHTNLNFPHPQEQFSRPTDSTQDLSLLGSTKELDPRRFGSVFGHHAYLEPTPPDSTSGSFTSRSMAPMPFDNTTAIGGVSSDERHNMSNIMYNHDDPTAPGPYSSGTSNHTEGYSMPSATQPHMQTMYRLSNLTEQPFRSEGNRLDGQQGHNANDSSADPWQHTAATSYTPLDNAATATDQYQSSMQQFPFDDFHDPNLYQHFTPEIHSYSHETTYRSPYGFKDIHQLSLDAFDDLTR